MASGGFFECNPCKALFRNKTDFSNHLRSNPQCCRKAAPRKDPHAFTAELISHRPTRTAVPTFKTIPDTQVPHHSSRKKQNNHSSCEDDTLLAVMEAGMKKIKVRKSGLETSLLAMVAEGNVDMRSAYSTLSIDPLTGKKKLSKDIVEFAAHKAKIDVNRVAVLISRAQNVSICFLLDTTKSMTSYITAIKEQIVEIVHQVQNSGCCIAGVAFVGYKDWCDGNLFFREYSAF